MLISTPYFGIILSIVCYCIGQWVQKKMKWIIFNPLLITIILIIVILKLTETDYETYNLGGSMISFFLGPATVLIALPLYKSRDLLKKNLIPVIGGIVIGSITSIASVVFLSKFFGLSDEIVKSFIPKSVTTPIGIEISRQLGGIPALSVAIIVATGIIGAMIGDSVLRFFKVKDEVSVGVAFGTASHAIGTSKALEIGKTQGAFSGLSIGLMGLVTVIIIAIFNKELINLI